ncbi:MAG: hypothetical protein Q7U75_04815, partial [Desulfobacterales bacterium]|nr:hypothetical protein [Desulfobacterales bacterium]
FEAQARESCESKAEQQAEEQTHAAGEVGLLGGRVGEVDQQDENEVYEISEHAIPLKVLSSKLEAQSSKEKKKIRATQHLDACLLIRNAQMQGTTATVRRRLVRRLIGRRELAAKHMMAP